MLFCTICASVLIAFEWGDEAFAQSTRYRFKYVGMATCSSCHSSPSVGDQVGAWQNDPHSLAYTNLGKNNPRLLAIKQKLGIQNPQTDDKCLKCHTTGGHRPQNRFAEGVGCEACHGPGEAYSSYGVHVGPKGYERALRKGMFNVIGDENIANRRQICMSCHNLPNRPCAPTSPTLRNQEKLTLQQIVASFNHKLRK